MDLSPLEIRLIEAYGKAYEASLAATLGRYGMVAFRPPYGQGQKFWHLFERRRYLSLCSALAVSRLESIQTATLTQIDCLACLDEFTARLRKQADR